jgi:membrane fusion protein (multidrug efflux system)
MSGREPLPSPSATELRPSMPGPVPADDGGVAVSDGAKSVQVEAAKASSPGGHGFLGRRRLVVGTLGVLALAAALWFGIPWIQLTLSTVSTDDAYVNGHVTFVAPRVSGQIARVLVDDNYRVRKGDILVQLDKEPYQDAVATQKAAVDVAMADLSAATATVRGIEAQARSLRFKLQYAMEDVENRVALLRDRVAALDKSKATLKLAQTDFARAEQLLPSSAISRQNYDQRQAAASVAQAEVTQH